MQRTLIEVTARNLPESVLLDPNYRDESHIEASESKLTSLFNQQKSRIDGLRKQYAKLQQTLQDKLELIEDLQAKLASANKYRVDYEHIHSEYQRISSLYSELKNVSSSPSVFKCDCQSRYSKDADDYYQRYEAQKKALNSQILRLRTEIVQLKKQVESAHMTASSTKITTHKSPAKSPNQSLFKRQSQQRTPIHNSHNPGNITIRNAKSPTSRNPQDLLYQLMAKQNSEQKYKDQILRLRDQLAQKQSEIQCFTSKIQDLEDYLVLQQRRAEQNQKDKQHLLRQFQKQLADKDYLFQRINNVEQQSTTQRNAGIVSCQCCHPIQSSCCGCQYSLADVKSQLKSLRKSESKNLKKLLSTMTTSASQSHNNNWINHSQKYA